MKDNMIWPRLLVDEAKVRSNVRSMKARAEAAGCTLRPHFKTHQSREIGDWLREEGITAITVSSFAMASYFAGAGWKDILIAMPANILLTEGYKELSGELDRFILMADHPDTLKALDGQVQADVVVEVDTGSDRSGVPFSNPQLAVEMVTFLENAQTLTLAGIYSHAGHTYRSRGADQVREVGNASLDRILSVREKTGRNIPVFYGDTPYATCGDRLQEVDIMTPGNFVFYDMMQTEIGSTGWENVAVCLACPVVSVHAERDELVIHGGAVHLSKDVLDDGSFGKVVRLTEGGWSEPLPGARVSSISQEHGVVALPEGGAAHWNVGDILGILPVHSCLTADVMGMYETADGRILHHLKKEKPD